MQEFSKYVGLEPATDLQRHLKALCQEAGLDVLDTKMILMRQETMAESYRFVFVWAHEPGWEREIPEGWENTAFTKDKEYQVEVQAVIPVSGEWPDTVNVRCMASDRIGIIGPTLRTVTARLMDLPLFLREVLRQQKEIIADQKGGARGPWNFGSMCWEAFEG